jgi:hypothetical protein
MLTELERCHECQTPLMTGIRPECRACLESYESAVSHPRISSGAEPHDFRMRATSLGGTTLNLPPFLWSGSFIPLPTTQARPIHAADH